MKWTFTVESPAWVPWAFIFSLIIIIAIIILIYRWIRLKIFYTLIEEDADIPIRHGPVLIKPFIDNVDLKVGNVKIGILSRKLGYSIKLEEGFVFKGDRIQQNVKNLQNVSITGNNKVYYFKLFTKREKKR